MNKISFKSCLVLLLVGLSHIWVYAQQDVSGVVVDNNGDAIIGATIIAKGTAIGTTTELDGSYSLTVPAGSTQLEVSYLGYRDVLLNIADGSYGRITLIEDVNQLDEVVITGLASNIKRTNLAHAISSISAEELTGVTSQQTVDGALYGKLPGVNIVQSNGAPGGGIALRLRGVSSLSGNNQPLWIVDGIYISNAEIPSGSRFASGANSGSEEGASNRIADINPEDIESIEVLKGASAAAIYGTRANAGVVIITTKKGKAGKTNISLDQDIGTNSIIKKLGRFDYDEASVREAFGDEEAARFVAAQNAGEIFNYEDEIYGETGFIRDTRLKITGGTDKTQFYIGGSVRDEDGIIQGTGFERNSIRLNLNHKISDKISIGVNSNYINSFASRSFTGNENEGGLSFGYTLAFTRDWVNQFPDDNGVYPFNPNYSGNPIFARDQATNNETNNRFLNSVKFDWNIFQKDNQVLRFNFNTGVDYFVNETFVHVPELHQSQVGTDNGFLGVGKNVFSNFNYQAILVHDYYTESGINFTTQGGVSYLDFDRDLILNRTTQLNPGQTNLSQGGTQEISQRLEKEEEFGIILQEEVNINDKIIATVGGRLDKSSLNGDPNQFFFFPKASLALNLTNFDFWPSESFNLFKVRVAYGETGSSASFGSLFTGLAPVNIGGNSGFVVNPSQGNANLEPERSRELEFGIDIALLENKLGIEASYYFRNVNNLLYDRSLPTSSGFSNEIRNDLDLRNTGLELGINYTPIASDDVNWNSSINFWFNRSQITRLGTVDGTDAANDIPSFVPPGVAFGLGLGSFFIDEGSPITGLWNNGDDGPVQTGDTEPDFQLGFYNEVKFLDNWNFNFLLHWKQGGDVLNLSRLLTNIGGQTPQDIIDFVAENSEGDNPSVRGFVEDASYVRLREIGLNYTLPVSTSVIEQVRFGVSARNLLTFTNYTSYDPETSTKGGTGLSTGIEVTPFPSSKQVYFSIGLDF